MAQESRSRRGFTFSNMRVIADAQVGDKVMKDLQIDLADDLASFQAGLEHQMFDCLREIVLDAPIRQAVSQALRRAIIALDTIDVGNADRAGSLVTEAVREAIRRHPESGTHLGDAPPAQ